MTDKKFNKRYDKLSPTKQFLHKNAGFICMGIFIVLVFTAWTMYTGDREFFDSWACGKILYYMLNDENYGYPDHDDLSDELHIKLHQLYANDCSNDQFTPPPTLDMERYESDLSDDEWEKELEKIKESSQNLDMEH